MRKTLAAVAVAVAVVTPAACAVDTGEQPPTAVTAIPVPDNEADLGPLDDRAASIARDGVRGLMPWMFAERRP